MAKKVQESIHAKGVDIAILSAPKQDDYICMTDIARYRSDDPAAVIQNWMRNRETIEYLGIWEELNNPNFKRLEFEGFRNESGRNAFVLSPKKWIDATGAVGIVSKAGRYGGTFAHTDIAFEFASWISPEFKLYIIKDYQRLKADETHQYQLEWSAKRALTKINYRIHTDAIKSKLIPSDLSAQQSNHVYANEADLLNVALFGVTAQDWKKQNPTLSGNMRDYAELPQLLVLANLESMNAELIKLGISQRDRLIYLRKMAQDHMRSVLNDPMMQRLIGTPHKQMITTQEDDNK